MAESYNKSTDTGKTIQDFNWNAYSGVNAFDGSWPSPVMTRRQWTDFLQGIKNPRWKQMVAAHQNAGTPMIGRKTVIEFVPCRMSATAFTNSQCLPQHRFKVVANGVIGGVPALSNLGSPISSTSAANDAAGAWYGSIRNAMSTFKGSVAAAEATDARRMMYDRASKMLYMIPAFQRRLNYRWLRSRTKRGKLKTLSNSWLELQFGWLPLASDIKSAVEALNNPTPMTKRVRGFGDSGKQDAPVFTGYDLYTLVTAQYTIKRTSQVSVRYLGEVQCRTNPLGSRLQDFGLGVREFVPTLWEVLPWSFAVDYFTNVSEILTALSYASVKVNWVNQTIRQTSTWESQGYFVPSPGSTYFRPSMGVNTPSSFKLTRTDVARQPVGQVPIPSLSFQLPSWKQALNLAALAVSKRLRLAY
jgi:hypothetical protein